MRKLKVYLDTSVISRLKFGVRQYCWKARNEYEETNFKSQFYD